MTTLETMATGQCAARRAVRLASAPEAPPLVLPAAHFAAAFGFLVLAGLALVRAAPAVAAGAFLAGPVTAAVHLVTLGWITLSIMGVLYQFLPVALGIGIASRPLAYATFALFVPGLLLFVAGAAAEAPRPREAGLALVAVAVVAFLANLGRTLARVESRGITFWGLAVGAANLAFVLVLGLALGASLSNGWLASSRLDVVAAHVHLALAGWVMPVVVGVSRRLMPMFLLAHDADIRPSAAALAGLGAGAPLLAAGLGLRAPWAAAVGAGLVVAALLAFAFQVGLYFRARRRPRVDPGMRMAATAVGGLLAAVLLGPAVLVLGSREPGLATAYGTIVLFGGFAPLVAGHYYRIVPFLVWYHRYSPLVGRAPVPKVSDLVTPGPPSLALGLLVVGVLLVAAAPLGLGTGAARTGGVLFAASTLVVAGHMAAVAWPRTAARGVGR
ncbi:MAG TPA: hypothetical protein VF406_20535 [Thermodesulfobacteriota bacterium]